MSCGGTLIFLSIADRDVGNFLGSLKVSRTLSWLRRVKVRVALPGRRSRKGPQLGLRKISWFLSSWCSKVGFPLELRRGIQGPTCGASGVIQFRCKSGEGPLGIPLHSLLGRSPHLELRPEPQALSPGLTWISGFLWGVHRGVRASSCVAMHVPLLSSRKSSVRISVGLTIRIGGFFSRGATGYAYSIVF